MNIVKGTDVSSYVPTVNWGQLRVDGFPFAYARCCDGHVLDTMHASHIKNARAASVAIGSYQYGHPSMDMVALVDFFLQNADFTQLRLVIDMESLSESINGQQIVPPTAGAWTDSWCERVKWLTKTEPIVYASLYYFEEMCKQVPSLGGATGWDWWMADYTGSPNHPSTPLPYLAHQYAGDVKLSNQVGLFDLDVVYNDNWDVLRVAT